jgi:signal transduction histidine kinase
LTSTFLPRPRLALWISLAGLAQFAAVAVGFWALLGLTRPPGHGPFENQARYVAATLAPAVEDPARLGAEVMRIRRELHHHARVMNPEGHTLASTFDPGRVRCVPPGTVVRGGAMLCGQYPVQFPGGRTGTLEIVLRERPPLLGWQIVVVMLVVVGVASWLLARALTVPLRGLSTAARRLGEGDLAARTGLTRTDELGEVARAFDEMADRVSGLLRAEKELLASVSHELRTPLARIRVALDIATEGDAATARESLGEIAGDLDELERLISDVLAAARLDLDVSSGGLPPLRKARISVEELVEQAAGRLRSAHPGRPLEVRVGEGLPAVEVDPVLLRRVLDNLLENAHRYTDPAEAPVRIEAQALDATRVEIAVVDPGIGIAPEDMKRIFQPFFRADRSRNRATGGLGLGLMLARRIVEAHGGQLTIQSELHRGTRALVVLPAEHHAGAELG